jgi:hypothetical protein
MSCLYSKGMEILKLFYIYGKIKKFTKDNLIVRN